MADDQNLLFHFRWYAMLLQLNALFKQHDDKRCQILSCPYRPSFNRYVEMITNYTRLELYLRLDKFDNIKLNITPAFPYLMKLLKRYCNTVYNVYSYRSKRALVCWSTKNGHYSCFGDGRLLWLDTRYDM